MIRGVHGTKKGQLLPASSCVPSRAPTDGTVGKVRSCAFIYLLCRRRYDKVLVTLRVRPREKDGARGLGPGLFERHFMM